MACKWIVSLWGTATVCLDSTVMFPEHGPPLLACEDPAHVGYCPAPGPLSLISYPIHLGNSWLGAWRNVLLELAPWRELLARAVFVTSSVGRENPSEGTWDPFNLYPPWRPSILPETGSIFTSSPFGCCGPARCLQFLNWNLSGFLPMWQSLPVRVRVSRPQPWPHPHAVCVPAARKLRIGFAHENGWKKSKEE